jgi:integrase
MPLPVFNALRARTGTQRDKVPILTRKEQVLSADEEFRRVVRKNQKAAPIEPPKAPAVMLDVAPGALPDDAKDNPLPSEPRATVRKKKRPVPPIPQEEEMQRFFKAINSLRDRAIFRIMYHAGLRASEIGLLEMRDYIPRTDRLMISRLKGSNSGEHHLCREEARALKAWLKERGNTPGAIFGSRKGGPISRQRLDALVKHYAARAAWPAKLQHCHTFKHACCTHLLSKGFNVEQVQDWVGHANIQNTMI